MSPSGIESRRQKLLAFSRELGREDRGLAILGEGNTSARLDDDVLLVKASGSRLATLEEQDLVLCHSKVILDLLDRTHVGDAEIDEALLASRLDPSAKKPSIESLFHAYLLTLSNIEYVGHTHGRSVNQVLCSPRAREFAEHRMSPDEVVYCGVASVFVAYREIGLSLAQAIRRETLSFVAKYERLPKVILLENHGIITLGPTPEAATAAMLMAEKAAAIWVGAAALGGPKFLSAEQVKRIAGRPDEAYRQRLLEIV